MKSDTVHILEESNRRPRCDVDRNETTCCRTDEQALVISDSELGLKMQKSAFMYIYETLYTLVVVDLL